MHTIVCLLFSVYHSSRYIPVSLISNKATTSFVVLKSVAMLSFITWPKLTYAEWNRGVMPEPGGVCEND